MAIIFGSDWGGSRLATAQTCKQKYYNRYERVHPTVAPTVAHGGIIRLEDSYAASRGTLLHVFFQSYYGRIIQNPDGVRRDMGLEAIRDMLLEIKHFNLPEHKIPLLQDELIAAADQYLQHYASETLIPSAVEKPVEVRITRPDGQIDLHTGIIDLEADYHGGLFVVDHKTTTQQFANLFNKYTHSLSFKGYVRALAAMNPNGERPVGVLINGLRFKNNKALECEFERETYMFTAEQMDEFDRTVVSVKREIEMCQSENFWPKSAEQCSQVWGLCEYFPLCKFDDPAMVNALYKPAPVKK